MNRQHLILFLLSSILLITMISCRNADDDLEFLASDFIPTASLLHSSGIGQRCVQDSRDYVVALLNETKWATNSISLYIYLYISIMQILY